MTPPTSYFYISFHYSPFMFIVLSKSFPNLLIFPFSDHIFILTPPLITYCSFYIGLTFFYIILYLIFLIVSFYLFMFLSFFSLLCFFIICLSVLSVYATKISSLPYRSVPFVFYHYLSFIFFLIFIFLSSFSFPSISFIIFQWLLTIPFCFTAASFSYFSVNISYCIHLPPLLSLFLPWIAFLSSYPRI